MNALEARLVHETGIDLEVLERARERLRDGQDLGDVLLEMGVVTADRWGEVLARHYGLPFVDTLSVDAVPLDLVTRLPIQFAKRHNLLPISADGDAVVIATADPSETGPIDDLRILFGRPVRAVVAPAPAIAEAINRAYDQASTNASDLMIDLDGEQLEAVASELAHEPRDLLESEDAAPIIRLVNGLFSQAVKDRASDIHVEPFERDLVV
ncbi:MAG: type II secretion system protein GspE, partial [Candidatus Binatia bacterium]